MMDKLAAKVDTMAKGGFERDDDARFWYPLLDKVGSGYAVIRFLPPPQGDEEPYVRTYQFGFKGPTGKWYIEESPSTIGLEDPVLDYNAPFWEKGDEASKADARKRSRKTYFISWIEVIDHPARPSDNGKRFLFKYGKKIFAKLNDKMNPKFQDEKRINPFDFWEGANFKLKIMKVEGFPNYDKSEFEGQSEHHGGDDKVLEPIWRSLTSLKEFHDPKRFKSFEELKKKFDKVMGFTTGSSAPRQESAPTQTREEPRERTRPEPKPSAVKESKNDSDTELEDEAYFSKLLGDSED